MSDTPTPAAPTPTGPPPRPVAIDVRYDEIGLKGGNRSAWEKRLRKNILAQTGLHHTQVGRIHGRLTIALTPGDDPDRVIESVTRTFGVRSASPVVEVPRDMAAIADTAVAMAREQVARGLRRFKVNARRPDKTFEPGSQQINIDIGTAVLAALKPQGLTVDCDNPEFEVGIEIRESGAILHTASAPGPGGLPVGVSGRGLLLLSGGIDSPVAGWQMMKRGLRIDSIYFHAFPFTGDKTRDKVLELARLLSRWSPLEIAVHVAPVTAVQEAIAASCPEPLWTVILRRFMYRIAAAVSERSGYEALVTGEALGQVASQTIANLRCVQAVVPGAVVFRPLSGADKVETVRAAHRIGTFATSVLPFDDCCTLFAPRRPATAAEPVACERAEADLDVAGLVAASVAGIETWIANPDGVRVAAPGAPALDGAATAL